MLAIIIKNCYFQNETNCKIKRMEVKVNIQKLILVILIVLMISINVYSQQNERYIKVDQDNLRLQPNGEILGKLNSGTKCKVLEDNSKWMKVQITGWIWKESLTEDQTMVSGYTIRASHILVNSEDTAQEILNQIKEGASFEEMARVYSIDKSSGRNGGDLGSFSRGDLNPEFENVAFKLEVGELSGIVKTSLGYHIIKRTK